MGQRMSQGQTQRSAKTVPRPGSESPTGKRDSKTYRNAELSAAIASMRICSRCGAECDTTHCHSNQSKYGKGKSLKASDAAQWCGCGGCHILVDQGGIRRAVSVAIEESAILKTYRRMCELGWIGGLFIDDGTAENWIRAIEIGEIYLRDDWRKM